MKIALPSTRRHRQGWLMVTALIFIATASIIGMAVALTWVREFRRVDREAEKQHLAELADTFRDFVLDSASIPAPTGFVRTIQARSGKSHGQVQANAQGNNRIILADPDVALGPLGNASFPFNQGPNGSRTPRQPRMLVVSSLGRALPDHLATGGTLTSAQFSNLWHAADGQMPADWNWDGDPGDLCIHRVQLEDLFVQVVLRYYQDTAEHRGLYLVTNSPTAGGTPFVLPVTPWTNSFLRGTYLCLHGPDGTLQLRDILQQSGVTYTCQNGVWRQGEGVRGSRLGPVNRHPTPEEFGDAVEAFMGTQVPVWPSNTSSTKDDLYYAITNFLAQGAYDNQGSGMSTAQEALIDAWVAFTGAQPNKP